VVGVTLSRLWYPLKETAMAVAETVHRLMVQHSIEYDLVPHPHTGSSHETAEASHISEDHIAKAVIVKDEAGYAMVVIPANQWLDMKHLREELDRELHLAEEAEIGKLFPDCETGAMPPLGPAYGIETFLDQALVSLANVYFEAGDHESLIHVSGDDFQTLLGGVRQGFYSHDD
jgi:Ala-tRNA(Pro) deacylase